MKAFSVLGTTKSGKTTTIENIVKEITRRGYSVGTIKEIHYENFAIDTPGTNTYRHRQAGAELVCARGYQETDIMYGHKLPIEEIIQFYTQDYLIMEGVADYNVPLIICASDREKLQAYVKEPYFSRVFAIAGKVSNQGMDSFNQIPVINAESSAGQLTDLVIEKVFDLLPEFFTPMLQPVRL
ncbi:MAG: molybdopterin-guanine dinucleotide biosynthesis protein B [Actinomycetota bacterium]|nr:molybdopterin-guanine dinucleotide biosynthesis protein B [Actinomycetota bacterium]